MESYKFRRMPWFSDHGSQYVGIPVFPPQEQQALTQPDQLPHQPNNIPEQTQQPEQSQQVEAGSGFEFRVCGWSLGLGDEGRLGFEVLWFWVRSLGFGVSGLGIRGWGLGFGGLGFEVLRVGVEGLFDYGNNIRAL